MMNFKFGSQIRAMRKAHKLTQEEFAKKAGISLMSLRRYESDERQPTMDTVSKLAAALGMTMGEFAWTDPRSRQYYFWMDELEDKLRQVGCGLGVNEEDAYLWITYPDGSLEVPESVLLELHESTNSYLRFKLEELKNKNISDFKLLNRGDPRENE